MPLEIYVCEVPTSPHLKAIWLSKPPRFSVTRLADSPYTGESFLMLEVWTVRK